MVNSPIRTFSHHYREKYGQAVGKIPVTMGQLCPNRKNGGCIYCRPAGFTPSYLQASDALLEQISAGKKKLLKGRFKKYFTYFQQETCTAIAVDVLLPVFELLLQDADCLGLILSTRPDYVSTELLKPLGELISKVEKECLFELGLQSVHEGSLQLLNRNHSFADFQHAVQLIKDADCFGVGAHLIFGIPGESEEEMLFSVKVVCGLGINALKLHHLQVIRGTVLEDLYMQGEVAVFTMEAYLQLLVKVLPIIPPDVTIHRLWATAHPDLLVAPKWNVLTSQLSQRLREKLTELRSWQGQQAIVSL